MSEEYMNDKMFAELLESVREGGAILRGEKEASRTAVIEPPDVKRIREQYALSQSESPPCLALASKQQNWEQGRRSPRGPASVLLQVAAKHPDTSLGCCSADA